MGMGSSSLAGLHLSCRPRNSRSCIFGQIGNARNTEPYLQGGGCNRSKSSRSECPLLGYDQPRSKRESPAAPGENAEVPRGRCSKNRLNNARSGWHRLPPVDLECGGTAEYKVVISTSLSLSVYAPLVLDPTRQPQKVGGGLPEGESSGKKSVCVQSAIMRIGSRAFCRG